MSGRWERLYNGETTINFVGRRWWGFGVSVAAIVITLGSLFVQGLNLGIDFEGGVAWEAPRTEQLDIDSARDALDANKIDADNAKIQILGGASGERIRIQVDNQDQETILAVTNDLAELAKVDANEVSVSTVSSSWGRSITEKAIRALIVFFVLVAAFISWRFEWKMAISALSAVVHDVVISVGVYSVLGFEVTPATVIAFLTILGFSLYDTIVVFDKVKDNADRYSGSRVSYGDIVNVSMNQVLMRSLNTSIAAVLPVLSLLVLGSGVFGAVALQEFAIALFVGLLTGAYSSIFIATPFLAQLKEHQPEMKALAARVTARRKAGRGAAGSDATTTADAVASPVATQASLTRTESMTRQQPKRQARSKRKG